MDKILDNLNSFFSDPQKVQLATVGISASLLTLSTVFGYQQFKRTKRVSVLKRDFMNSSIVQNKEPEIVTRDTPIVVSADEQVLIDEQLTRHDSFFGTENLELIKSSFVIVVGAGGVGSWAAYMLARSGVQRIRIIDFDLITLSSLNRHAVATRKDVGLPKVDVLKSYLLDIVPHAKIECRVELFQASNAKDLLSGNPNYVLDCIDNIDTKLDLLTYCHSNKIRVISSMGAGMKADPSRVQIADIGNTFEDPLSRAVRRRLKKLGIESGIEVVYSTEKPGKINLAPLPESGEQVDEFSILPDFRVRVVPVLGTMPAIFGMVMATKVLTDLGEFPTEPLAIKGRHALYNRIHRDMIVRETKYCESNGKKNPGCNLTIDDCGYLLEEVWRGKSAISQETDKLALVRWQCDEPISFQNCVCMTKSEATKHYNKSTPPEAQYPRHIVEFVESRFQEELRLGKFR
ncbi:hypothetical protein BB560_004565 [Smittium megazygosporum]|uniref:THIF-type NAD/FAD binding fold domain-containing protein n=1 Tax=Smittium megazygosporum TaxID=133381 RepID=A0A2T9Z905_9FUNG|nr:hypothetical protein BB560_004565 [Smittium megazygosporum]